MWSLFVLVALAVGCSGQGTLSIPPNCERASCMAYVQWTPVDNDNVQFELEATALGWVAVGVSADAMMGVNGIDDVFACQRDATNNIVYAQDTFNPENQTTRANTRDSDQNGFLLISSSFSGERISCTFIRSVLASNPDEDRNLTEAAFILLAFGDQRGGPDITLARHDGGSRRASDAQVTLTDAVPMPVGMLGIPPNCERASCMAYVQWTPVGSATVRFELEGEAEGWVAVGVSADRVMGVNGIDDVFACQRDSTNDTVYAEDTYNPQNQSPRGNTRDSDQSGFVQLSSSFSGGRISCSFVRSVLADNVAEDRNLNVAAYLLLAFGNARGGPDIALAAHNGASRRAADAQVTLTAGTLSIPPNCERASCMAYVQWTPVDSATVQFELEATTPGWVAVGVSADQVMGGDGIDDVFACQRDATNDIVYAQDTFNPENQTTRANTRDSDQRLFELISSSFTGGRISCSFIRSVLASNPDEDRNLNVAAFILLAFGDQRGGPNITLAAHNGTSRRASPAQVTLTDGVIPMPVGMLSIPPNCERDSTCMAYAQWAPIGTASVRFELLTTAPGWVAVGVSADRVMGGDGIDDVFACQRDNTTDTVYAQDTFNPQNQSRRGNTRDSDQNGFVQLSSSFSGERISCSFVRSVLADNPAEDRDLNVAAFVLLAFGNARGGPDITLAGHNGASRRAADAQVTLTQPVPAGMLSIPPNCERASCMAYVQWTPVDNDNVQFELEATAPGWVAVGVSADQVMGGDGIDDVFACQRDATNDIVYAQDTFNPENQTTRANTRDSDQSGFLLISSSFSDGRISCTFIRSVLASNPDEDRNLNVASFILLAFGPTRGGPNITLAAHNPTSRRASPAQVTLTDGVIPMPVGMLGIPPNCERDSTCMAYAQWAPIGTASIRFELLTTAPGWVAVGVSADRMMGGDGIDDVFACQRDGTTDIVYAQDTFNPQNQAPRGNTRDSNQNGFQLIGSTFSAGRIMCSFVRSVLADNPAEDRNLNVAAYLLLAFGNARGGPDITLAAHNGASRRASAAQVTLTDGVSPAPPAAPMSPVGTFAIPAGCSRTTCRIFAQWNLIPADTFEFQLEAAAAGWVAIGVSADAVMGVNGIDDVFACQRDGTTDTVYAEDTFNPQNQAPRGNTRDSDQTGFQLTTGSFTNGRISCTFTRTVLGSNDAEDRNLSVPAFVLIASGAQRGGPNIALSVHGEREATAQPVDLAAGGNVVAGCGVDPLIRMHGILMYLAWVWLVPTAYFFAASMRPAMPTGTWFQIHRALMLAAIVPSAIGFILIFVAFRNNNSTPGLITLGSDNPIGTTHYVFGIVIIFLQFLNPIISICRCKPGGKFRWIFNLIHGNIIGWGVILLALVNVSLGLWQYSGLAYGQTDNSRYYPFWIWIAFLIVYTFWDSFLFIYSKCIGPRLDKMWKKGEKEYEMKPTNADSSDDKEEPPKKMPSKDAPIRYGFMIFNILLLVVPGLIIMLLIAIGCI